LLGEELGLIEGLLLGTLEGPEVGESLGDALGPPDGEFEGESLGDELGLFEGELLGPPDGIPDGRSDGAELGLPVGPSLGLLEGESLGEFDGEVEGFALGSELLVGVSDGALLGKKLPLGAALGSPHSTLIGSQGISILYAQKFSPISLMSSTSQASHSSSSKSVLMYMTTVACVIPFTHWDWKFRDDPNVTSPVTSQLNSKSLLSYLIAIPTSSFQFCRIVKLTFELC